MKKVTFLITILALIGSIQTYSQSAQFINYQAVARDASGDILSNKALVVEVSILEGSVSGTTVWQEGHSVSTNGFGLFNIKIGTGNSTGAGTLSSFDSIKWHLDDYYLSTRIDFGNGLVEMGTTRFLAVPYAFYALTAGNSIGGSQKLSINDHELSISDGNTIILPDNVEDDDADSTNELQSLSISGKDISISSGNSITLPITSYWDKTNDVLNYQGGNIAINSATSYHDSTIFTLTDSTTKNIPALAYFYSVGSDNFFGSSTNLHATIEAINGTNSSIVGEAIGNSGGTNKGVYGYAKSGNSNYGVEGYAQAGSKATNNNFGVYGIANGTTNGFNLGVFGEGNGSSAYNRGLDGRTAGTGSYNDGVFGQSIGAGSGQNRGVYGFSQGSGFVNYGVIAETRGIGSWNIALMADANGSATTNYGLYARSANATTNYAAFIDGDLTYTGTLTGPSDAKLKENVIDLNQSLSIIDKLNPVTYSYKDSYKEKINLAEGKQYGFIAQELEKVIPELVTYQEAAIFGKDENMENKPLDKLEFKGINYIGLIPILTAAIQEQQQLINAQKEEIDLLKNQNEQLFQKFEELESRLNKIENK
jgi:hypothetical protein